MLSGGILLEVERQSLLFYGNTEKRRVLRRKLNSNGELSIWANVRTTTQSFADRRHATRTNVPDARLRWKHRTGENAIIEENFIKNTARFSAIEENTRAT